MQNVLPQPQRAHNIDSNAQWLSGIGEGSWFLITKESGSLYRIIRWSQEGAIECNRLFRHQQSQPFFVDNAYEFTYPSHCQTCTIQQGALLHTFVWEKNQK